MIEYPENSSVLARVQCLMRANNLSLRALESVEALMDRIQCEEALKDALALQVERAITAARLARDAASGE